jgi:hypothetical protein
MAETVFPSIKPEQPSVSASVPFRPGSPCRCRDKPLQRRIRPAPSREAVRRAAEPRFNKADITRKPYIPSTAFSTLMWRNATSFAHIIVPEENIPVMVQETSIPRWKRGSNRHARPLFWTLPAGR